MGSLKYLNTVLTVLALLLSLQLWGAWVGGAPVEIGLATPVQADGIPNAGSQRQQMVDLMKKQVQQTQGLIEMFNSGQARVRLEQSAGDDR